MESLLPESCLGVSGLTLEAQKLIQDVQNLVRDRGPRGANFDGPDTDEMRSEPVEVIVVNGEVVRRCRDSPHAPLLR